MKTFSMLAVLCITLSTGVGCSTTSKKEMDTYFEDGRMDGQVQSWKKPGGRYIG